MNNNIIYLCAAPEDRSHLNRLRAGLHPVTAQYGFSLWHESDTGPGSKWKEVMKYRLASSAFFVPLVSMDLLASDICNIEIQAAVYLATHGNMQILPILLSPCLLEYSDLAGYPCLPKNGKPIISQRTSQAWASTLRDLIETITSTQRRLR